MTSAKCSGFLTPSLPWSVFVIFPGTPLVFQTSYLVATPPHYNPREWSWRRLALRNVAARTWTWLLIDDTDEEEDGLIAAATLQKRDVCTF